MRHVRLAAVALLTILVTCDRPNSLTGPSATISDGTHAAGNRNFFFLPPLVPDPRDNPYYDADGFDPDARPTVEICHLTGGACAPSQPAGFPIVFSMDAGRGSETVRVDVNAQHYIVNWHAGDVDLDPASNYRIQVLIGGAQLGYADVDVVSSGRELRNVNTNEFIGLVDGRTLPIKFRIERGAMVALAITEIIAIGDAVVPLAPIAVDITEAIGVTDAVTVLAPLTINVAELIQVADAISVLPPARLDIAEVVTVSDQPVILPPVQIAVLEMVGVRDQPGVLLQVTIAVQETITVTDVVSATPN